MSCPAVNDAVSGSSQLDDDRIILNAAGMSALSPEPDMLIVGIK
jgi:hypothetical protein